MLTPNTIFRKIEAPIQVFFEHAIEEYDKIEEKKALVENLVKLLLNNETTFEEGSAGEQIKKSLENPKTTLLSTIPEYKISETDVRLARYCIKYILIAEILKFVDNEKEIFTPSDAKKIMKNISKVHEKLEKEKRPLKNEITKDAKLKLSSGYMSTFFTNNLSRCNIYYQGIITSVFLFGIANNIYQGDYDQAAFIGQLFTGYLVFQISSGACNLKNRQKVINLTDQKLARYRQEFEKIEQYFDKITQPFLGKAKEALKKHKETEDKEDDQKIKISIQL